MNLSRPMAENGSTAAVGMGYLQLNSLGRFADRLQYLDNIYQDFYKN